MKRMTKKNERKVMTEFKRKGKKQNANKQNCFIHSMKIQIFQKEFLLF